MDIFQLYLLGQGGETYKGKNIINKSILLCKKMHNDKMLFLIELNRKFWDTEFVICHFVTCNSIDKICLRSWLYYTFNRYTSS